MRIRKVSHTRHARIFMLAVTIAAAAGLMSCGDDDDGKPTDGPGGNTAPVIDSMKVGIPVTAPADSVQIWCFATDSDSDQLTYSWQAEDGTISGNGPTVKWVAATGNGSHRVDVAVGDGRGGVAQDSVSIEVMEGSLLVQTRGGLVAVDARGGFFTLSPITTSVEVLGTQIFMMAYTAVVELDQTGAEIRRIDVDDPDVNGHDFVMLPSGGFVFASNNTDTVHFMQSDGTLVESVPMPNPSPESLQNIDGIVVGNRLMISENGNKEVLAFDLTTREGSIFRSFPDWGGWLGAIDHNSGLFYLCGRNTVRRFSEAGEPEDVAVLPAGNITGIVVVGNYAYAVLNFDGTLYRIDARTGVCEILVTGLDYPQDVEYFPLVLEPPGK